MRFDLLDEYASAYTLRCRENPWEQPPARSGQDRTARRAALAVIALMIGLSTGTAWLGF